jgi:hypothetical protein
LKLPYSCTVNPATVVKCDESQNTACQLNTCNPSTGKCSLVAKKCDDKDPCTSDTCDPAKGCVFTPGACP